MYYFKDSQITRLLSLQYPNITKLLTIAPTLPVSTVDCERGFSRHNLIKTQLRSRLLTKHFSTLEDSHRHSRYSASEQFRFQSCICTVVFTERSYHYKIVNNYSTCFPLALHLFIFKTCKWWIKLFFWLLQLTVVNSYVLYKAHAARLNMKPLTAPPVHLQGECSYNNLSVYTW